MPEHSTVFIIVGPTGIGKTTASLPIAAALNAEIISADSRQIYRKMNIATAKPTNEEQSLVPHHFIDIVDPDEVYDAGRFGEEGRRVIADLWSRKKNVMVVGGSGLYIRSLIDGFFEGVDKDLIIRETIKREIRENGLPMVYQSLRQVDPESAVRIHPNDAKRIERAIEVYRMTGKPISELYQKQSRKPWCRAVFAGLRMERQPLYQRIDYRVDQMIQAGAMDETKELLRNGYLPTAVSMEGLGYREIIQYLNQDMDYETMIKLFKQHSRNYAKRQITWFGKDQRIRWFDAAPDKKKEALVSELLQYFTSASKNNI